MKRYGNLHEKIVCYENIQLAHKNAQKGKRHYADVKRVNRNYDAYLQNLQKMLSEENYTTSEYKIENRNDTGKEREIYILPYYPDRIVHHCIMNVVEPIWKNSFIRDTYAAIKGRGIHDGVKRIKLFLKDIPNTKYCLKLDVKKFYPSIKHHVLESIILRKIKCRKTIKLLFEIIRSAPGVPIGHYLSQYLGNLVLSLLDHFSKHVLKIKYYSRYCDDIVIFGKSKRWLKECWRSLSEFLENELELVFKENGQIFPTDTRGVDYLGYKFFHDFVLVRKSVARKFANSMIEIKAGNTDNCVSRVMSYFGWLKYANAKNLWNNYVDELVFNRICEQCREYSMRNPLYLT